MNFNGLGLCFSFSSWCCLCAGFYSLKGTSTVESVTLRSGACYTSVCKLSLLIMLSHMDRCLLGIALYLTPLLLPHHHLIILSPTLPLDYECNSGDPSCRSHLCVSCLEDLALLKYEIAISWANEWNVSRLQFIPWSAQTPLSLPTKNNRSINKKHIY